jgi:hypothetical protein
MSKSNKEVALEVLKRAFIDRDPTVVGECWGELQAAQPRDPGRSVGHCESDSDSYQPDI